MVCKIQFRKQDTGSFDLSGEKFNSSGFAPFPLVGASQLSGLHVNGNTLYGTVLVDTLGSDVSPETIVSALSGVNQTVVGDDGKTYGINIKFQQDTLYNEVANFTFSPFGGDYGKIQFVTYQNAALGVEQLYLNNGFTPPSDVYQLGAAYIGGSFNEIAIDSQSGKLAIDHEFFHLLGIGHNDYQGSLMFPYQSSTTANYNGKLMGTEIRELVNYYRGH